MPSRVRVAAVIGGRVHFGRQGIGYLRNVADSAGVLISNRKKGAAWEDILSAWEVVGKYLDGCKLYVIRERRGLKASCSLFNHKLLGYRRKKKKVGNLLRQAQERGWAEQAEPPVAAIEEVPVPARRHLIVANAAGELVYEDFGGN